VLASTLAWAFSALLGEVGALAAGVDFVADLLRVILDKIFSDEFAIQLTGDELSDLIELRPTLPPSTAAWVLRSRYAEDRLAASIGRGVRQYVLLGAGLDSFACRHFGSMGPLTVYEVLMQNASPGIERGTRYSRSQAGIPIASRPLLPEP
jgi:hypothetical protein